MTSASQRAAQAATLAHLEARTQALREAEDVRLHAIYAALDAGCSAADVARAAGLSRQWVSQINAQRRKQ